MGKPKLDKQGVATAVRLKKGGANNKDIAAALCVHERTVCKWVNEPKSENQRLLGRELKKAEADYKNALLGIIAKNAKDKDWKAAAWLLERKYPAEYSRRTGFVDAEGNNAVPTFVFVPDED